MVKIKSNLRFFKLNTTTIETLSWYNMYIDKLKKEKSYTY